MKTAPVGSAAAACHLLYAWLTTLLLAIMLCGCGGGHVIRAPPPPLPPAPGISNLDRFPAIFLCAAGGCE